MATWLDYYKIITSQAQANSALRASSPAAFTLPMQYMGGKTDVAKALSAKGPGSIGHQFISNTGSVGKKILDILARFNYASANVADKMLEQQRQGRWNNYNFGDVLKMYGEQAAAGWQGLSGQNKETYSDVFKKNPQLNLPTSGVGGFATGFGADVILDPTSYLGVGAVRHTNDLVRALVGKAPKAAEVISPVERAVQQASKTGTAVIDTKNANKFLDYINKKSAQNPIGDAARFDVTMPKGGVDLGPVGRETPLPKPVNPVAGSDPRLFVSGPGGTSERFMLPGPPAEVAAGRATLGSVDKYLKDNPVLQFNYGHEITQIPESGFWNEVIDRVPKGKPIAQAEAAHVTPDITKVGGAKGKNPLRTAILNKLDEQVPTPGGVHTMGQLRAARQALLQAGNKKSADEIAAVITNHLDLVEQHAATEIKNKTFKNLDEYMRDNGYMPKSTGLDLSIPQLDIPNAAKAAPAPPDFTEVKRMVKMSPAEKVAFFQKFPWLSKDDARYLAQASNHKSYLTRLNNVKGWARNEPTRDVADLINAIDTGRLVDEAQPGMPALLKKFNVKTLKQLSAKLKSTQKQLTAAEKKMIGNVTAAHTQTIVNRAGDIERPMAGTKDAIFRKDPNIIARAHEKIQKEVTPADVIVEKYKAGDKTDLARPKIPLGVEQTKIYDQALKIAMEKEVILPNSDLYKYVTRRGVKRTSATPNKGYGRWKGVWNKFSQYSLAKGLMADSKTLDAKIKKVIEAQGGRVGSADARFARADAYHEIFMPVLKSLDETLKQGGVFPVAGIEKSSPAFSLFDALDVLGKDFAIKHFFSAGKGSQNIPPTMLMDSLVDLHNAFKNGADLSSFTTPVERLLQHGSTRGGKTFTNYFASYLEKLKSPAERQTAIEDLNHQLIDAMPELMKRVEQNTAQRKLWHDNNVGKIKTDALDTIAKAVADPEIGPNDMAKIASGLDEITVKTAQRLNAIDPEDIWYAKNEVRAAAGDLGITPELSAAGAEAKAMSRAKTPTDKMGVGAKAAQEADIESQKLAEGLPIDSADLGQRFERSTVYRLAQAFSPHLGNADIRPFFLDRNSFAQTYSRKYSALLSEISRKHTQDNLVSAWGELQRGTRSSVPEVSAAQDDLAQAVYTLFAKDPAFDVFARNNLTTHEVNAHFKHYGIPAQFSLSDEIPPSQIWKTWDTKDPVDLLSKMQAATLGAASKRLLADDIAYRFGSSTPKAGYVKVTSARGKSVLSEYLDTSKYYPREIAKQFHILDSFMKNMMQPPRHNGFLKFYDSFLHSYKAGLTIYRPGHHARNMVGDGWLAYMAGVTNPIYYTRALKIMAQNHGRYNDFDAIAALMSRQPFTPKNYADTGKIMATVRINGKAHDLTGGEVYRAMADVGLLNDYRTLEDIAIGQEAAFRKFKPFGGKLQRAAASTSEARDHYVRIGHFLHSLEHGKYTSLKDAIDKSAKEVRKWHPDGTDLTRWESQVMRRTFLFYSWTRKAIPLIAEGMVMRPGRFMQFPKAMYNVAEAQGINLNSYEDPFPTDQLFPEWIRDQITGPVAKINGHYIGANPGVPMADVFHDFLGPQAGKSILGSTTPLIKWPMEILGNKPQGAFAQDLRTGVPSYDATDYIDKQIPGFGYLSSITGRSPSQGFTQPRGGEPKPGQEAPGFNPLSFLNFLTGAGIQDYSKPAYIKQAKREQTQKRRNK